MTAGIAGESLGVALELRSRHRSTAATPIPLTMWCPSCGVAGLAGAVVCRRCLVQLVADPDATVRCRHCGHECPARMQSCPACLSELHTDPAAADAVGEILAGGGRLFRPDGLAPFDGGPDCSLLRLAPRGGLVYTDSSGVVEASVKGCGVDAVPPLTCQDFDGSPLFHLVRYQAAAGALVAMGGDGAPLATYLRDGRAIDIRDETSAPVARLVPGHGSDWSLVETGGGQLGVCSVADEDQDGWVDDQWSLRQTAPRVPLRTLAAVAMVLAAKALMGRTRPVRVPVPDGDDESGYAEDTGSSRSATIW